MEFLTNEKLTIVGAAGMIGSNMAQTAMMMRLTPNICLYDPFAPALEAGDTLIGVNARQLPAGFPVDAVRVITHLRFVAIELFFLLGGYPAVGRHPLEEILCAVYIQRLDGCWDGSYPFRRCVHALHPIAPF